MRCFISATFLEKKIRKHEDVELVGHHGKGVYLLELAIGPCNSDNVLQMPSLPWYGKLISRPFSKYEWNDVKVITEDRRFLRQIFNNQSQLVYLAGQMLERLTSEAKQVDNHMDIFYSEFAAKLLLDKVINKMDKTLASIIRVHCLDMNGIFCFSSKIMTGPIDYPFSLNKATDLCSLHEHGFKWFSDSYRRCTMYKLKLMSAAANNQHGGNEIEDGEIRENNYSQLNRTIYEESTSTVRQ